MTTDSIHLVAYIINHNRLPWTVVEGYIVSVEWRVNIIRPVI
jgi:hypothetical protein